MDRDDWDDRDFWDDGPDVERVFDDGTTVAADEPLPPGLYISRTVVDVDYDHHDGVVTGADEFIETTRITPQMRHARLVPVPRPAVRSAATAARRSVANGGRRRRSRSTAGRASPSRSGDDPEPSQPALRRAAPGTIRSRDALVRGSVW